MRIISAIVFFSLLFSSDAHAQQGADVWSLQRCVQYAIDHNISIRQDSLTARLARYTLQQSELSQLPTLNANTGYGRSFGRSVSPTTNQYVDASYNSMSASANANVLLFGWMQVRNSIARNKFALEAAVADLDQLKDDISVNVANGFLVALLAKEQINVSRNQVSLSQAQLDQTRAFADAGRLPELNVAQLESQVATDSANLINSIASYNGAILDLKTLLNLDFAASFEIEVPGMDVTSQAVASVTQPEEIFQKARAHFGSIKANEMRVKAAEKGVVASKAALLPQLSLAYQAGTSFAANYQNVSRYIDTVIQTPSFVAGPGGTPLYVQEPYSYPVLVNTPFGTQLGNNFRQILSLNLNIPIFNGWQGQYTVRQSRINLAQQQLNEYNAELTLKQNVYKAHNNAINSIQKYYAAKRADEAAKRALDFARKRYDLGLTSTVDLLVTQNSEFAAAANYISAKYDLIFKLKVIDYYMGKELKL